MRIVAWVHILIILSFIAYSTYWLFSGDFGQALLPYPLLILYYLLVCRRRPEEHPSSDGEGPTAGS